jgi:ATP-binding cassette subfamily F protein 3
MAAVTFQNVCKSYDGQIVLRNITLDLHSREKVGLIGANGSGKTTLLKLALGLESPDSGTVTVARGTRLAFLPQTPDLPAERALLDAVHSVFDERREWETRLERLSQDIACAAETPARSALLAEYDRLRARFEAAGGYNYEIRLREVLGGLGFDPAEYQKPVRVLSGGQKCRAALARMLLRDADLLLLDEPTNHLDIDATRWLEKYLAAHDGGAVIISHDRYLLDRVVTKIIEVENHEVTLYPTNYTNYAEAKRLRRLTAQREYEKQSAWLARQRDYIDRVRYAKDSAKQARGRQKFLDRMEADGRILDKPAAPDARMKLRAESVARAGEMVLRCTGATKAYDGVTLIDRLDFEMVRGEKVGIIGPNGVGKTTLLRMLLRQTPPDDGEVRLYENLAVGYYDQEHRDLDGTRTVLEAVRAVRPQASEAQARAFLAMFLFQGDDVFKHVASLSGGEQSRVLLARLLWTGPQVLVLDEPTNHLDIPAREALEEALRDFPGGVLMVSHDRYFLDRTVDRLLDLSSRGEHELVAGNYSTYADLLTRREEARRRQEEAARCQARARHAESARTEKAPKKSRSKYARQRVEELEHQIIAAETRQRELESAFADPAQMKDAARARRLHEEYTLLKEQLQSLNDEWERAIDAAE